MSYKLPPNGQWTQKNIGDATGSVWSSFNLDLTVKNGDTKITRLLHNQSTSSDLVNLGLPVVFTRQDVGTGTSNSPIFTVAGARVFDNASGTVSAAFAQDSRTTNPTTCSSDTSDAETFNGSLYVTTASNSVYKTNDNSSWSTFTAGAADSTQHALCQYGNRMYMQRAYSQIISWDTADTVATSGQYTLQLPNSSQNVITFMRAASDKIWIGTVNTIGGQGHVYSWDGSSGNPVKYTLNSGGALSGVIKNDTLWIVDSNGALLVNNGGTFEIKAKLPNFTKNPFYNHVYTLNDRFIHPRGSTLVEGDRINILVKTVEDDTNSLTEEMCPSGVWEYDESIGLYHKYSISYIDKSSPSITDYGQSRLSAVGGLAYIKSIAQGSASNGTLLAGCKYYTNASSTKYGIFFDDSNDSYLKAGYLVTTKIPSSGITDEWQELILKFNNFISASDKIVVKYRLVDTDPIEATITWTSTTTFTTTTDVSSYITSDYGYEVEIVQGTGAGMCSHITDVSYSGGTYTVTVDETHTGVTSGTAIARFQKWIKVDSINDVTITFQRLGLNQLANSNFIQLKIFMLMYGSDELKEIDIKSIMSQEL